MNNRFVFIVPAYNAAQTISRCIFSVWFQTHSNWKIIIKDDMSTDGTPELIESIKKQLGLTDDKIVLHVNNEKKWEGQN